MVSKAYFLAIMMVKVFWDLIFASRRKRRRKEEKLQAIRIRQKADTGAIQ
jgi:hypothetical protein